MGPRKSRENEPTRTRGTNSFCRTGEWRVRGTGKERPPYSGPASADLHERLQGRLGVSTNAPEEEKP